MTVPFIFASFYIVNFTPIGFIFCETFLGRLSWVCLSTLFKAQGIAAFVGFAYEKVAGQPSYWGYDIMIVGPILFPTLLGNMGPMFVFGFDGYLQNVSLIFIITALYLSFFFLIFILFLADHVIIIMQMQCIRSITQTRVCRGHFSKAFAWHRFTTSLLMMRRVSSEQRCAIWSIQFQVCVTAYPISNSHCWSCRALCTR